MASVSSLDQDMRSLRLARYTPQAANEVRTWVECTLNEKLPPGDLLSILRDGVALCKLINLLLPYPGIKYKTISMPFVQMENISHFLKACEQPPLSMPSHDRFLTVDLYEGKDPAQVLQCLGAFSRRANELQPSVVKTVIGPRKAGGGGGALSPTGTGANGSAGGVWGRSPSPTKFSPPAQNTTRALSPTLTGGSTGSREGGTKSPPGPVTSWSKKSDEGTSAPAWNIHQYGYMGGASQGNQGISFGARRQITSQAPAVPSIAERERLRKEKEVEEERQRVEAEEKREFEEQQARLDEERRWEEETRRARDEERKQVEEQKRQWAEQERRWKEEEEARRKEDTELAALQKKPPEKPRVPSSGVLRGQTLSQYQKEQAAMKRDADVEAEETPEHKRVRELEKQLEEARERERQYQSEREERLRREGERSKPSASQLDGSRAENSHQSQSSWAGDEREVLRQQWQSNRETSQSATTGAQQSPYSASATQQQYTDIPARLQPTIPSERPALQSTGSTPSIPQQPLQPSDSQSSIPQQDSAPSSSPPGSTNRPLPTPNKEYKSYMPSLPPQNTPPQPTRTERFLNTTEAPTTPSPRISSSQETGQTSLEQSTDRDIRLSSQAKTKAGGFAAKSLLEREMERERARQQEWELAQEEIKGKPRDVSSGSGPGQGFDVNQYGFVGGDGMGSVRGSSSGSGIDFGGRRQILGPREMGSKK